VSFLPHSPLTTLIGFSALILIFMLVSTTSTLYVGEFKEKIAKEELEAIGSSIASQIVEALSLSKTLSPGQSVLFRIKMPDECALGHYDVLLEKVSGKVVLMLKPSSLHRPKITVVVPISNATLISTSTISSGAQWNYINITVINGFFQISLIYTRGTGV